MSIDRQALLDAIDRLHDAARRDFEKLNDADGALGDGDLGITLKRGMELVTEAVDNLPDDLGKALLQCAQAFTRSSGSSYGTLMATGLMAMAKALKGETDSRGKSCIRTDSDCQRCNAGQRQSRAGRQDRAGQS